MTEARQPLTTAFKEGDVEVEGFRLHYWESDPPQALGTVVMLEGMTWGLSSLRNALGQTYRVVSLELPGFGASPANTSSQSIQELASTMAQATTKVAPASDALIGTSFGANVAFWQTLQTPKQVETLVLISPTMIQPMAGRIADASENMGKRLLAHPENVKSFRSIDPAIVAKEQALVQQLMGEIHDAEAEHRLDEITCATLVVFGSEDHLIAPEAAGLYRERIPNCNLSFVYDAGHLIEAERPEALVNAVLDYLERRETFVVGRRSGIINP